MSCNQQPESSYQTEPEYIHPIQFNSSGIHYSPSSLKQSKVFGFLLECTSLHGRFFPQLKEPSADQMQTFCYLNLKTFHALHLGTMRRFGQRSKVWFLEHEEELNHVCSIDYDWFFFWTCKWTNKYIIVMSFHNPFLCSLIEIAAEIIGCLRAMVMLVAWMYAQEKTHSATKKWSKALCCSEAMAKDKLTCVQVCGLWPYS